MGPLQVSGARLLSQDGGAQYSGEGETSGTARVDNFRHFSDALLQGEFEA